MAAAGGPQPLKLQTAREIAMNDDTSKRDFRDRDRVSGSEEYEVEYFAKKHNISPDQVRALIKQHGNNREALEAAAAHMKRGRTGDRH